MPQTTMCAIKLRQGLTIQFAIVSLCCYVDFVLCTMQHISLSALGLLCTQPENTTLENTLAVRMCQLRVSSRLSKDNTLKALPARKQRGLPDAAQPVVQAPPFGSVLNNITNNVDGSDHDHHSCTHSSARTLPDSQRLLAKLSRRRCHRWPIYGSDLRRSTLAVTRTRTWRTVADEDQFTYMYSPYALVDGCQAPAPREQRCVEESVFNRGGMLTCAQDWYEHRQPIINM